MKAVLIYSIYLLCAWLPPPAVSELPIWTKPPFKIDVDKFFYHDQISSSSIERPQQLLRPYGPCKLSKNDHLKEYTNKGCPPDQICVDKDTLKKVDCELEGGGTYCDCPTPPPPPPDPSSSTTASTSEETTTEDPNQTGLQAGPLQDRPDPLLSEAGSKNRRIRRQQNPGTPDTTPATTPGGPSAPPPTPDTTPAPCPRGCSVNFTSCSNEPAGSDDDDKGICSENLFPDAEYAWESTPPPPPPESPMVLYRGKLTYGEKCEVYGDLIHETEERNNLKQSEKIKRLKASGELGKKMCRWTPDNLECIPNSPRPPATTEKGKEPSAQDIEKSKQVPGKCDCRIALGPKAVKIDYDGGTYCYIGANRGPHSNCDHVINPPYGAIHAVKRDGTRVEKEAEPASNFCVPGAVCKIGFKYIGRRCMCNSTMPWNYEKYTCRAAKPEAFKKLAIFIAIPTIPIILPRIFLFN